MTETQHDKMVSVIVFIVIAVTIAIKVWWDRRGGGKNGQQ